MPRPLAPSTEILYDRLISRAFGSLAPREWQIGEAVLGWPNSQRELLRTAVMRRGVEAGIDPRPVAAAIPLDYQIKREIEIPTEEEAVAYEAEAMKLRPGLRTIALLPLKLGLRATEVTSLTRASVQRAVRQGELVVLRKGGREQTLKVGPRVQALLAELLALPAKRPRPTLHTPTSEQLKVKRTWNTVGEALSYGAAVAQYHGLHKLVRQVSEAAGITGGHPHLFRHAFATRMNRDGAPLATIQRALDHANPGITARYVHPSDRDVAHYIRD